MIKIFTAHGNKAAVIIDKALVEILNIDMNTPLETITDGENLIISQILDDGQPDLVAKTSEKVNARHEKTLKKVAD